MLLRLPHHDTNAFNGATARTRWNDSRAAGLSKACFYLQWGHRANAVERLLRDLILGDLALPSMGPPRERGGTLRISHSTPPKTDLQWGHRANAVERHVRLAAAAPVSNTFNGATARTRWNDP